MTRLQRAAILTDLASKLIQSGSWCGETHLQKTTYFLQELFEVPTAYTFILYKFGPFSFDLRDELTALQADGLMELQVRHSDYGPALVPSADSENLRRRYPRTLEAHRAAIDFVCRTMGPKGVADLERVATALYVTREVGQAIEPEKRARRLRDLKPHVNSDDARSAIVEIDEILRKSTRES